MDLKALENALRKSWGKDTCYPPMRAAWSEKNPAYGQCHCTVLVVNDYFGGKILKYLFKDGTGHYSNYIDGKEIDFTRCQFDENEVFPEPRLIDRKDTEDSEEYFLLKKRIEKLLRK